MSQKFVPSRFQPALPMDRLIVREQPGEEAVPMDVLFVGAGPAGLSGAIELARLVKRDQEAGGACRTWRSEFSKRRQPR
ncbi:MAG: hypothetical protein R3E12_00795 [Candidatus Eisenbacteria bacterium]